MAPLHTAETTTTTPTRTTTRMDIQNSPGKTVRSRTTANSSITSGSISNSSPDRGMGTPQGGKKLNRVRRSLQVRLPSSLTREHSLLSSFGVGNHSVSNSSSNSTTPRGSPAKKKHATMMPGTPRRRQQQQQQQQQTLVDNNNDNDNDVRDGRFFHLRVTLGYLTGLMTVSPDGQEEQQQQPEVCFSPADFASVYASFEEGHVRKEYDFAISYPIRSAPRQTVQWPKQADGGNGLDGGTSAVKTSKRRLYHSVLLRTDDSALNNTDNNNRRDAEEASLIHAFTFSSDDGDSYSKVGSVHSSVIAPPSRFAPAIIPIHLGLVRGVEKVPLGVATLVINGTDADEQKIDLQVRPVEPKTTKEKGKHITKSLKKLFGKRKNGKNGNTTTNASHTTTVDGSTQSVTMDMQHPGSNNNSMTTSLSEYRIAPNAILRIKVDIQSGIYEKNGPGLWGDLNDDEESFGPIPVIDIPDDYTTADLTNRYSHESIEVLMTSPSDRGGNASTTILSSPGLGFAVEGQDSHDAAAAAAVSLSPHDLSQRRLSDDDVYPLDDVEDDYYFEQQRQRQQVEKDKGRDANKSTSGDMSCGVIGCGDTRQIQDEPPEWTLPTPSESFETSIGKQEASLTSYSQYADSYQTPKRADRPDKGVSAFIRTHGYNNDMEKRSPAKSRSRRSEDSLGRATIISPTGSMSRATASHASYSSKGTASRGTTNYTRDDYYDDDDDYDDDETHTRTAGYTIESVIAHGPDDDDDTSGVLTDGESNILTDPLDDAVDATENLLRYASRLGEEVLKSSSQADDDDDDDDLSRSSRSSALSSRSSGSSSDSESSKSSSHSSGGSSSLSSRHVDSVPKWGPSVGGSTMGSSTYY